MSRNRIVFGDASYLRDGVVKARRLRRGEAWKQAYVAVLKGLCDQHGLEREFLRATGSAPTGKPIMTWTLPQGFQGVIELGWWSDDVLQKEPLTHYILCIVTPGGPQYLEITEAQAYREMILRSKKEQQ